jgi:hypothetical protein
MSSKQSNLTLQDLLKGANLRYEDAYLSAYFDPSTGRARAGTGDGLAEFIVRELRETFDESATRAKQIALAIRTLQRAGNDIQNAIDGLGELE